MAEGARSAIREPPFEGVLTALLRMSDSGALMDFSSSDLQDVAGKGVGKAARYWRVEMPEPENPEPRSKHAIAQAILFGALLVPSVVTQLSEDPSGGVTLLSVPVLSLPCLGRLGAARIDDSYGTEPMLNGLAVLCWHLVGLLQPEEIADGKLVALRHKAEVKEVSGSLWFQKACNSNRVASVLFKATQKAGKRKRIYMYRGGGSLDASATSLADSIVVLAKNWILAGVVHLALWLATACSPFTVEAWPDVACTVPSLADSEPQGDDDDDSEPGDDASPVHEIPNDVVAVQSFLETCEDLRDRLLSHRSFREWPGHPASGPPLAPLIERLHQHHTCAEILFAWIDEQFQ